MPTSSDLGDAPGLVVRHESTVPVLELPEGMTFEALRAWLRAVLPGKLASIGGQTCRLDFRGRPIVLFDLRRLVGFLRQEFSLEVSGLYVRADSIIRFAERELKLKLFVEPPGPPTESTEAETPPSEGRPPSDHLTPIPERSADEPVARILPVTRTLRSGKQVRYDGDILVYGDVNPGAHVVATGNIVVFGALKGVAHAGAHGDTGATVLAFDMRPTQVRIARKIAIPGPRPPSAVTTPQLAALRGEPDDLRVVIEPFQGRFPG